MSKIELLCILDDILSDVKDQLELLLERGSETTMTDLEMLGKAYYNVPRKDIQDQDARGWNKALDAIWKEYKRIIEDES